MFPRNIRKFSEQLFQWITKKLTFTSKKEVYLKWQKPWLSVTIVTLVFFSALFLTHFNFLFSFRNIFSSFLSPYEFLKTELSCRNLKLYLFSGLERITYMRIWRRFLFCSKFTHSEGDKEMRENNKCSHLNFF